MRVCFWSPADRAVCQALLLPGLHSSRHCYLRGRQQRRCSSGSSTCARGTKASAEVDAAVSQTAPWWKQTEWAPCVCCWSLQIEQSVKLCRFLACTAAGTAASAAGSSGGTAAAAVPVLEALKAQLKAEVDTAVSQTAPRWK